MFNSKKIKQYAIIEREKEKSSYTNLILKQIGFVGGGTQILAGYTVCKASLGLACASFGAPLMAHGYNNVVENGYYLLYRENINGGVREGYIPVIFQVASLLAALTHPGHIVIYAPGDSLPCRRDAS
ncbi:DUF4225 domain-containing protein [Photorhabdus africana]|uniref:DUF4225 domain-containing protein n=1 Tax=Photorhabdus africana TaxID=3097554 RepID=UPI002B416885|nr:DUF4225 domain-containing protein [Photorhabdus sp. CRI-LC]